LRLTPSDTGLPAVFTSSSLMFFTPLVGRPLTDTTQSPTFTFTPTSVSGERRFGSQFSPGRMSVIWKNPVCGSRRNSAPSSPCGMRRGVGSSPPPT